MIIIAKLNLILPIIVLMKKQFLIYEADQNHLKLISTGEWTLNNVLQIEKKLRETPCDRKIIWDVSAVSEFDSAGVLLFIEYFERFQKETDVEVVGYTDNQKEMYNLLAKNIQEIEVPRKKAYLESLGKNALEIYNLKRQSIISTNQDLMPLLS
jgi:phospholipid/cholesterol/gamma-HCH transport system permease protein